VKSCTWCTVQIFIRTAHCIYANLKRARYTVMQ
jgi:hypothetical protein